MVGHEEDLAGVAHDGSGDAHLVVVKIDEGAVGVDARHGDDAEVHLELTDKVDGGLAGDAQVVVSNHPTGDENLKPSVLAEDGGDV